FPEFDPVVSTLLSLSSFAMAFIARPIGGAIFGHFGDRLGRKSTLVITLTLMGCATLGIGLLPTYATIGVAAPILLVLLRVLQGLSLGGEYGGAVLMSVEHAGEGKRGFFGAIVNTGAAWGLLLANLVFLVLARLPDETFNAWGWRIPFLLSVVLVVLGLMIRLKLAESPEFAEVKEAGGVSRAPIVEVLARHWRQAVLMMFAYASAGVTFYIGTVYSLSYGTESLALERSTLLTLVIIINVVTIVCIPFFGWLSDRVNRRAIFLVGIVGMIITPYLWFLGLESRSFAFMLGGFLLLFIGYMANYGTMPTYFAHVFPADIRYTGLSIGYTFGTIISSAIAPIIATALLGATGSWLSIALYMSGVGVVSAIAALFLKERYAPRRGGPPADQPARTGPTDQHGVEDASWTSR
ncbi:MAG: MFS transporter, partial [Propionibacteriaceae bacterium]